MLKNTCKNGLQYNYKSNYNKLQKATKEYKKLTTKNDQQQTQLYKNYTELPTNTTMNTKQLQTTTQTAKQPQNSYKLQTN